MSTLSTEDLLIAVCAATILLAAAEAAVASTCADEHESATLEFESRTVDGEVVENPDWVGDDLGFRLEQYVEGLVLRLEKPAGHRGNTSMRIFSLGTKRDDGPAGTSSPDAGASRDASSGPDAYPWPGEFCGCYPE